MPARQAQQHAQSALRSPAEGPRAATVRSHAEDPRASAHVHMHGTLGVGAHAGDVSSLAHGGTAREVSSLAHGGTARFDTATDPLGERVMGVRISSRAERAATWLSLACAVHCLLMPIAISVMPLLSASSVTHLGPTADNVLTLLVVASALAGLGWGYRRHRDMRVVYATGVGLAAYLLGHAPGHALGDALAHSWYGMALGVLGALTLAGSSFLSARLSHACQTASCAH